MTEAEKARLSQLRVQIDAEKDDIVAEGQRKKNCSRPLDHSLTGSDADPQGSANPTRAQFGRDSRPHRYREISSVATRNRFASQSNINNYHPLRRGIGKGPTDRNRQSDVENRHSPVALSNGLQSTHVHLRRIFHSHFSSFLILLEDSIEFTQHRLVVRMTHGRRVGTRKQSRA